MEKNLQQGKTSFHRVAKDTKGSDHSNLNLLPAFSEILFAVISAYITLSSEELEQLSCAHLDSTHMYYGNWEKAKTSLYYRN